jgi:hypothetical protein
MTILDHLEQHLGPIEEGWSTNASGLKLPFLVARLPGGSIEGTKVFATAGLSDHLLTSRTSSKVIRQELAFVVRASFGDRNIPGLLQQVGMNALEKHTAYLRGDVIGPYGRLFEVGEMEALYVGIPVYLPSSFESFTRDDGETTVLAWVIPISASETAYVRRCGWGAFEDELTRLQPDLSDPTRRSIATAEVCSN